MSAARMIVCAVLAIPAAWFAGLLIDRVPPMGRDGHNNLRDPDALKLFEQPPGLRLQGRYLAVFVAMMVMYVGTAMRFTDEPPIWLVPYLVWWCGLVPLAIIDAIERRLPDRIVLPLFVLGTAAMVVAAVVAGRSVSIRYALIGTGMYFGVFLVLNLIHPALAAFGDVKASAVVGMSVAFVATEPSQAFVLSAYGIFVAFVISAVMGFAFIAAGGLKRARERRVGLGTYLVAGGFLVVMASSALVGA